MTILTPEQRSEIEKRHVWDYCPSCSESLDTGWECSGCGRDWIRWAYPWWRWMLDWVLEVSR